MCATPAAPGSPSQDCPQEKTGYSSGEEGSYLGPAGLPAAPQGGAWGNSQVPDAHSSLGAHAPTPEGEEARLVDGICTPGGLRAQPDRADLQTFVESLGSLDGGTLVELLTAKIVRPPFFLLLPSWLHPRMPQSLHPPASALNGIRCGWARA